MTAALVEAELTGSPESQRWLREREQLVRTLQFENKQMREKALDNYNRTTRALAELDDSLEQEMESARGIWSAMPGKHDPHAKQLIQLIERLAASRARAAAIAEGKA